MVGLKQDKPSINTDNIDNVYFSMSKALSIFVKKHTLKFEEVDIVLHRLEAEWFQKKMDMYFGYLIVNYKEDKPINDSSYVK